MVVRIQINLIYLRSLIESIKNNKLKPIILEKEVQEWLLDLDKNCQKASSNLTIELKDQTVRVLSNLNKQLKTSNLTEKKIDEISKSIYKTKTSFQNAVIDKPKIDLKIAFFCDVDAEDHNGSIVGKMCSAVKKGIPFITTRSILRVVGSDNISSVWDIEEFLFKNEKKWEIFKRNDSKFGDEFLLFLPKKLLSEKKTPEKLKSFDFVSDGSLKKISLTQALQGPKGKNDVRALFNFFTKSPKISKWFYIAGHGGGGKGTAGLYYNHYREFLNFLKRQKCRGLSVTSCYSGGTSSMMHSAQKETSEDAKFYELIKRYPYSVLVHSIGDFITSAGDSQDLDLYLEGFSKLIEHAGGDTVAQFRAKIKQIEKKRKKSPRNLIKIYFPPKDDTDTLGGFQVVGEGGNNFDLNYVKLRQLQIEKHSKGRTVKNKDFLQVSPLVVDLTIIFKEKDSVLLSMVPGNSHHFIKKLRLVESTSSNFIEKTVQFHNQANNSVDKGFVFGKIQSDEETFEQVTLHISRAVSETIYRQGDHYYYRDLPKGEPKPITPFQYAILLSSMIKATKPDNRAVRSVTGGQQSEQDFLKMVQSESFWSKQFSLPHPLFKEKKLTKEIFDDLKKLNQKDKESFVFYLLELGQPGLALEFIKKEKLSPNISSIQSVPLICQAVLSGDVNLVDHLIENGADLSQITPKSKRMPLHIAASKGNVNLVKQLLKSKNIDIDAVDKRGLTPLMLAFKFPEIFDILLKKKANLEHKTNTGTTLLSGCARNYSFENLKRLIKAGADPNGGKPSALIRGIIRKDPKFVEELLNGGGKPFDKDQSGRVPLIEAIKRSTPDIVNILLKHKECNVNVIDNKGVTPLIAALFIKNQEKIDALVEKGITLLLPKELTETSFLSLKFIIDREVRAKDYALIEKILEKNKNQCPEFEALVTHIFLESNPTTLKKWINTGLIHPESKITDHNKMVLEWL